MEEQVVYEAAADDGSKLDDPPESDQPDSGFGGIPASAAVVTGLEKQRYSGGSGDDGECPICMMDYEVDDD
ncbi:hypothetical protein C2845_PM06G13630 [Panicum miliaceum]|uniref:Uncharacterized protein n=1 Tax=Panicum miliaceum TaxID=4540 RepID=A0A3L6RCK3_PANMI|nr:hypothetical protein C2845_PM06G13630 [Panicum miliaceum]